MMDCHEQVMLKHAAEGAWGYAAIVDSDGERYLVKAPAQIRDLDTPTIVAVYGEEHGAEADRQWARFQIEHQRRP